MSNSLRYYAPCSPHLPTTEELNLKITIKLLLVPDNNIKCRGMASYFWKVAIKQQLWWRGIISVVLVRIEDYFTLNILSTDLDYVAAASQGLFSQSKLSLLVWIHLVFINSSRHRDYQTYLRILKLSAAFQFLASCYAELELPSISDRESPCGRDVDLVKYKELKNNLLLRKSQLPKVVKCEHGCTCEDTQPHLRSHFISPISVKRLIGSNKAYKDNKGSPKALLEFH